VEWQAQAPVPAALMLIVRRTRIAVLQQYTSNLERWGAPSWSRWIALGGLACILAVNLGVITFVWLHGAAGARKGLLITLWLVALAAAFLLLRLGNALRRDARARGGSSEVT
jgi:high-affinity Fe2+/Pb2+ permease